jgi:hypothetical protein
MARDVDRWNSSAPEKRRGGGLRPMHVLGVAIAAVVGIVVAFWALSFVAGIVWGLVKAVIIVGIVGGLVWLFARRRRR